MTKGWTTALGVLGLALACDAAAQQITFYEHDNFQGRTFATERAIGNFERFGFNEEPPIAGAARSTIPASSEIGDDLAVGSSAICQGKVLATPLQMATVAGTIGNDGVRAHPTLLKGADPQTVRAYAGQSSSRGSSPGTYGR